MKELTSRQAEVLEFIRTYLSETGYPPTRLDISRKLGFKSANAAEEHLKALARKNVIEVMPGTSRGIKLKKKLPNGVPVVGKVSAGKPILAPEHIDAHYEMNPEIFDPPADYLLRVNGDSMIEGGIHDGDLLVVHDTDEVKNNDLVVARVDGEVTVKRFRKSRSKYQIMLMPQNSKYSPSVLDSRHQPFNIEGKGVGLMRHYR